MLTIRRFHMNAPNALVLSIASATLVCGSTAAQPVAVTDQISRSAFGGSWVLNDVLGNGRLRNDVFTNISNDQEITLTSIQFTIYNPEDLGFTDIFGLPGGTTNVFDVVAAAQALHPGALIGANWWEDDDVVPLVWQPVEITAPLTLPVLGPGEEFTLETVVRNTIAGPQFLDNRDFGEFVIVFDLFGTSEAVTEFEWAAPVDGSWDLASNWSPTVVPDNGDTATLGMSGPYTVTLASSARVTTLNLNNPEAVVAVPDGRQLRSSGTTGSGTVIVNSNQGVGSSILRVERDTVFESNAVLNADPTNPSGNWLSQARILQTGSIGSFAQLGPTSTVTGSGRIDDEMLCAGVIAPGHEDADPIGVIQFSGGPGQDLMFVATSRLKFDLGGTTGFDNTTGEFRPEEYDQLVFQGGNGVADFIQLAGTVEINLVDGFTPSPGDEWVLLSSFPRQFAGSFDDLIVPPAPTGFEFRIADSVSSNVEIILFLACLADVNGDGAATPADFNAWVLAFNNQAPECDQNGDGQCNPADFNAWILNFNAGC